MRETWKECVGFPNYQISNLGRTRNKDKIMKPHNRWDGYYHIGLWGEDGKRHYPVIHRLVALAFLPNPQNLPLINHSYRSQRKEILHPNQEVHSKRLFPTDGSTRSWHRQTPEQGEIWSTHYLQEQTLCPSRKFNSNQLPDRHVRGTDFPIRKSLPWQDWSAITLLAYGYFWIYQNRQANKQSAQSHVYRQDHGTLVQRKSNHRDNARWLVVPTRLERNVGTINVPVRSHTRLIFTFAKWRQRKKKS